MSEEEMFLGKYEYGKGISEWEGAYTAVPYKNFEKFKEDMQVYFEQDKKHKDFLNFPVWIDVSEKDYDIEVGAFQPRKGQALIYIIESACDEDVEKMQEIIRDYWETWMEEGFDRYSSIREELPSLENEEGE